jgi:hypothetical protein
VDPKWLIPRFDAPRSRRCCWQQRLSDGLVRRSACSSGSRTQLRTSSSSGRHGDPHCTAAASLARMPGARVARGASLCAAVLPRKDERLVRIDDWRARPACVASRASLGPRALDEDVSVLCADRDGGGGRIETTPCRSGEAAGPDSGFGRRGSHSEGPLRRLGGIVEHIRRAASRSAAGPTLWRYS